MTLTFYLYPNCSTCRKAKKWFDEHEIDYISKHIVDEPPTRDEILKLFLLTDLPARKFFNTNGKVYRELNLKDEVNDLSTEEIATILASNGMLIKRPIVTDGQDVTVGFKEDMFKELWLKKVKAKY